MWTGAPHARQHVAAKRDSASEPLLNDAARRVDAHHRREQRGRPERLIGGERSAGKSQIVPSDRRDAVSVDGPARGGKSGETEEHLAKSGRRGSFDGRRPEVRIPHPHAPRHVGRWIAEARIEDIHIADLVGVRHLCEHAPSERRQECRDRKSTRLNSSHPSISYAVFCLKKKKKKQVKDAPRTEKNSAYRSSR